MAKPIQDNLRSVRIIDEHGDLRALLDVAGEKLSALVKAVSETGKAGTLTLKIDVKPSTAGAQAVRGDINLKLPKTNPAESLLFPTPEGNLLEDDPRQTKLELKKVDAPTTELKSVNG